MRDPTSVRSVSEMLIDRMVEGRQHGGQRLRGSIVHLNVVVGCPNSANTNGGSRGKATRRTVGAWVRVQGGRAVAVTTTRASTCRTGQTPNLRAALGWIKTAHPVLLLHALRRAHRATLAGRRWSNSRRTRPVHRAKSIGVPVGARDSLRRRRGSNAGTQRMAR